MEIETWVIFALLSSAFGGILSVLDKIMLTRYSRDVMYLTVVFGILIALPLLLLGAVTPVTISWLVLGVGALFRLAIFFYMMALSFEEASRVVPLWLTSPVFVLVWERLFLVQPLFGHHYAGMALVLGGSFFIMTRHVKGLFKVSAALLFMLCSAFLFSIGEFLLKVSHSWEGPQMATVLFSLGLGSLLVSLPLFFIKLKSNAQLFYRRDWILFAAIGGGMLFFALALFVYNLAVSRGPISLVSTLSSLDGLFVFLYVLLLSIIAPSLIKEQIDWKTLLSKSLALAIIVSGVFFIAQ